MRSNYEIAFSRHNLSTNQPFLSPVVYKRFRVDGLKRYVNDDRFRVDGDKNIRLLAFAFAIVFVWTGPKFVSRSCIVIMKNRILADNSFLQLVKTVNWTSFSSEKYLTM